MSKKLLIVGILVVVIVLGFLRDSVFIPINEMIEADNSASGNLVNLKWILTIVFSLLYLICTCTLLYVLFQSKTYIAVAMLCYAFLFSASLLIAVSGYLFFSFRNVYPFMRDIMGVAQSPVVMMILIPACFLNDRIGRK